MIGRNGQPFKRFESADNPFSMEEDIKLLLNYNAAYSLAPPPSAKPLMVSSATSPLRHSSDGPEIVIEDVSRDFERF